MILEWLKVVITLSTATTRIRGPYSTAATRIRGPYSTAATRIRGPYSTAATRIRGPCTNNSNAVESLNKDTLIGTSYFVHYREAVHVLFSEI